MVLVEKLDYFDFTVTLVFIKNLNDWRACGMC